MGASMPRYPDTFTPFHFTLGRGGLVQGTEVLNELSDQCVIQVKDINIKNGTDFHSIMHVILTFNKTELPKSIKAGYLPCRVRPQVQTPIGCYQCHRFSHSKFACCGSQVSSRCESTGILFLTVNQSQNVQNSQPHEENSQHCPTWQQENRIQKLRATKTITYAKAGKLCLPTSVPSFATIVKQNSSKHLNALNNGSAVGKLRSSASIPQMSDTMLADNLLLDDTDISETDDFFDYDPEETIQDIRLRAQKPSTSSTCLNWLSFATLKIDLPNVNAKTKVETQLHIKILTIDQQY
ncbi:hypothetical protein AVEN_142541-1 [Araneus ventricosus]|uniref:Uncharacterized protein n=1 Tax=Araneus ventricosus TaxID=182803 RepID=A0A4Y2CHK5_ARAVE|nr:hypothetical protein AVEN_142541-1 [Araneus ventricosus]